MREENGRRPEAPEGLPGQAGVTRTADSPTRVGEAQARTPADADAERRRVAFQPSQRSSCSWPLAL